VAAKSGAVEGLDLGALRPWLADMVPELDISGVRALHISGGRSNLTFQITDGERSVVLRRPPLGHMAATAHDMSREYRVMSGLAASGVPVPRMIAFCSDETVLGAPFYVMGMVEGAVYRTEEDVDRVRHADRELLANALIDTLADLHSVDPGDVGLGDFGRPDGFLDRQLRRWGAQVQDSLASGGTPVPGIGELAAGLARSRPSGTGVAIVHGDYRMDNVIFKAPASDGVAAVLDWEMATIGDPMADLGMFCMYWTGFAGLGLTIPASPGVRAYWPNWDRLVARYAERRRVPVDSLDWYVAFSYYKIAVILDGVYRRHLRGLTVGDGFSSLGAAVPRLVERGLDTLRNGFHDIPQERK
jgi:aminoglycoside phosphotransferase (APT) family kinase protein